MSTLNRAGQLPPAEFPEATVVFKKCDVSSWDEQAAVFKEVCRQHRGIHLVMANAGVSEQGTTSAITLGEEKPSKPKLAALNINLVGTIYSE
jgi:NAD(P)-dependent dehydrogenase (short-subunit alcohol dehydrogenase family)